MEIKSAGYKMLRWLRGPLAPAYFDGAQAYDLIKSAEGEDWVPTPELPFWLVLSRACYTEQTRSFPAIELNDLKAVLKLEYGADPSVRYLIVDAEPDVSRRFVMVWRLRSELDLGSRIWIPETLALSLGLSDNAVARYQSKVGATQDYWLAKSARGLVSTPVSLGINSASAFAVGASLPEPQAVESLSSRELPRALVRGLAGFKAAHVLSLLPAIDVRTMLPRVALGLAPLALMLVGYLGVSSAYLAWQKDRLEADLGAVNGDVVQILDARTRYESAAESLTEMSAWLKQQSPAADAWLVLRPLLDTVRVESFRREYNRIVIAGTAPRATEVLERLSADTRVVDARFDEPTSQSGNRDYFIISFRVNRDGGPV